MLFTNIAPDQVQTGDVLDQEAVPLLYFTNPAPDRVRRIMAHPDLAKFVRERRQANGLSQTELARLAGVGRRFLSELENGKVTVRLDKTLAVLKVFGKDLALADLPVREDR